MLRKELTDALKVAMVGKDELSQTMAKESGTGKWLFQWRKKCSIKSKQQLETGMRAESLL